MISKNYQNRYEKIYESVKIKDVMEEWTSLQTDYQTTTNLPDMNDNFFMPLILNKQLGHNEIKNAKHWKISNECYQCDRWKYTYIFWNVDHVGRKNQIKDPLLEEMMQEMIYDNNCF